jgi:tRNA pseudouridine38-40 synthase
MRILVHLTYDGHDFHGWQVQPWARTVQQVIEDVLLAISGQRVPVTGSGRTDAGVHARAQAAHFDWPLDMTPYQIRLAMNAKLPPDVRCTGATIVAEDFTPALMLASEDIATCWNSTPRRSRDITAPACLAYLCARSA